MVVHIVFNFFGRGAISGRAREEVKALLDAGHRVSVITDSDEEGEKVFDGWRSAGQLRFRTVGSIRSPAVAKELSFAVQCYGALANLARRESIDLVVSHGSTPCYATGPFTRQYRIPGVFVIQALIRDRIEMGANPYSWVTTQMYRHANRYGASKMLYSIAISCYIRRMAIAEGAKPENAFVLHNPVDMTKFHSGGHETKDVDVLFVGRLSREKGIEVLVEAAHHFPKDTRMLIVGDGPLRKVLERSARDVECAIAFAGWIENEMLGAYIRRARLQVVPSLSEPQGLVVLEGMACGVPVIGTDVGGIPDMITNRENGWLVPPNNAKALAKTINAVLGDDSERERVGRVAYDKAQAFSTDEFCRNVVKLYERMIRGRRHK